MKRHLVSIAAVLLTCFHADSAVVRCEGALLSQGVQVGSTKTARMAYPLTKSIASFDPQIVPSTTEANLARNLYSRLVNLDDDGQITAGIALGVEWTGSHYEFEIRNDTFTFDGHKVGAYDAYLSLLRILINDSNTHGSLRQFLCAPGFVPSLKTGCSGLTYDSKKLILRPIDPNKRIFLLPLLASADFSIIPSIALDLEKGNLPIKEYRNTSGPYYVAKDSPDGKITLKVNKRNYLFNTGMIETLHTVPVFGDEAIQEFVNGTVDILTTINGGDHEKYRQLAAAGASLHETMPFKLQFFQITDEGRRRHSLKDRLAVGSQISEALRLEAQKTKRIPTFQFFPKLSDGRLTDSQESQLKSLMKEHASIKPLKAFRLGVAQSQLEKLRPIIGNLPFIEFEIVTTAPWRLKGEQQPDGYIADVDSAFYENISMIYYNFATGKFGTAEEGKNWLDRYMATPLKQDRIEMLNRLHFSALKNGFVFPISFDSYLALARQPMRFSMSKFYAGSPLWKLTIQ